MRGVLESASERRNASGVEVGDHRDRTYVQTCLRQSRQSLGPFSCAGCDSQVTCCDCDHAGCENVPHDDGQHRWPRCGDCRCGHGVSSRRVWHGFDGHTDEHPCGDHDGDLGVAPCGCCQRCPWHPWLPARKHAACAQLHEHVICRAVPDAERRRQDRGDGTVSASNHPETAPSCRDGS